MQGDGCRPQALEIIFDIYKDLRLQLFNYCYIFVVTYLFDFPVASKDTHFILSNYNNLIGKTLETLYSKTITLAINVTH